MVFRILASIHSPLNAVRNRIQSAASSEHVPMTRIELWPLQAALILIGKIRATVCFAAVSIVAKSPTMTIDHGCLRIKHSFIHLDNQFAWILQTFTD